MKWTLDFPISKSNNLIDHSSTITLLGSCFSDEIHTCFKQHGFHVFSNPFGTLFHPLVLAQQIRAAMQDNADFSLVKRQDVYLSWEASGTVFDYSEEALKNKLNTLQANLKKALQESSHLFITLGSAFGYGEIESGKIVANCHKMPANLFRKSLTDLELLKSTWSEVLLELHRFNPALNVVFTVSPVRHIKEGLIENNRSKARLIELVNYVCSHHSVAYFPAYEIVLDELRDYRFYKSDGFHPNELAIAYVWEKLQGTYMQEETIHIGKEYAAILRLKQHTILYTESEEAEKFEIQKQKKIQAFCAKYPLIQLE